MLSIIILTNKKGSHLEKTMLNAFANFGVIKNIDNREDANDCFSTVMSIGSPLDGIITVFDSGYKGEVKGGVQGTVVLAACCERAIKSIAGTNITAITCGTNPLDTLSIASCGSGYTLVSLQREIRTLSGRVIEPCDISIKTEDKAHIYSILATCAVMLLSDFPHEQGYSR